MVLRYQDAMALAKNRASPEAVAERAAALEGGGLVEVADVMVQVLYL